MEQAEYDILLLCIGVFLVAAHQHNLLVRQYLNRGRGRGRRRWWVRTVNRTRIQQWFHHNLMRENALGDHEEFFANVRMWPEHFDWLHNLVRPFLQKRSIREPLPTRLRVGLTLMYLAQGFSAQNLHSEFRVGKSTVYKVIGETCETIWNVLHPTFLPQLSREDWAQHAKNFFEKWQMPHCVGAVDGKHIRIKAPPLSGSAFHNYKGFFSIVRLASVDAQYKFQWVDIGQYGSISDGGVWANSNFGQALSNNEVGLPPPAPLPDDPNEQLFPYYFVGDEAFPLGRNLMRPFPGRTQRVLPDDQTIFNYRLSRARRVSKNAFGTLVMRWQVLNSALCCSVDKAESIIKAVVVLHYMQQHINSARYVLLI